MSSASSIESVDHSSWRVTTVLLGGSMFTLLAGASIAPALPSIKAHFIDHPQADLFTKLVLSLTALCVAVGAPFAGWAADRFGRRRLLIASILGTGIGGTAGYFAWSLEALLATRVILGLSVAATMTAVTALIADLYAGEARRRFLGLQSAAMKIGGICFLLLGGWLAGFGWREPFLVDLLAFLILPGAVWAILERRSTGQAASPRPIAFTSLSSWRTRAAAGLVFTVAAMTQIAFYMLPTQLPFLLAQELRLGPREIAACLAINALVAAAVASQYRHARSRVGLVGCLAAMFSFMALGHVLVAHAASLREVAVAMLVSGVGVGLVVPTLSGWILDLLPDSHRGRAAGWLTSALFTGQFVSPLLWQAVVVDAGVRAAFRHGAFGLTVFLVITALAGLEVRRRQKVNLLAQS